MPRLRQNVTAQMGTRDIWMWSTRADIFTTFTIRMTPSRWKVSTLICAIISQHWPDGADVFQGNWRTFRQFLLFSFRPITVLDSRRTAIVPAILAQLSLFLSLTSFNSSFGHPPILQFWTPPNSARVLQCRDCCAKLIMYKERVDENCKLFGIMPVNKPAQLPLDDKGG